MKELNYIQTKLKAPKNQKNSFGGYSYRSLEDITEAVKPLLAETGCTLTFEDSVERIGTPFACKDFVDMGYEDEKKVWHPDVREIEVVKGVLYFLKSTATLTNSNGEKVSTCSCAEHALAKKGMDPAQLTGATSSYARKYAACGLFAIDDNRDPDATNDGSHHDTRRPNAPARQSHAPRQDQKNTNSPAPQKAQAPAKEEKAPAPAAPQEEDPREKQLKFMASMGITREMLETAMGKDFYSIDAKDSASLRTLVSLMRKEGLPFDDAWERVCIMESNQEGESK